jgi:GNAT superfamily N-acetyltransferase
MELRDAGVDDLAAIYTVWRATELAGSERPPPEWPDGPGTMPWFSHLLAVGRLVVAVDDGVVTGFAGLLDHGRCVALSDFFVDPARQSGGIGRALLDEILPPGRPSVVMASTDPRALGSYARRGMRPRWPAYYVGADAAELRRGSWPSVEVEAIGADDYRWELPGDAEHYARLGAVPLSVRRDGRLLGTALVMTGNPQRLFQPDATEILESTAPTTEDAEDLVLGAVAHLRDEGASRILLQVPGPHPALAPLLERGFRITDVDTACASAEGLLADPERHTMHGESRVAID